MRIIMYFFKMSKSGQCGTKNYCITVSFPENTFHSFTKENNELTTFYISRQPLLVQFKPSLI